MRVVPFFISALITAGLIYACNRAWPPTLPMPLGKFLSPQNGFWQNAEPSDQNFDADLKFPDLKGTASVYFDDRLVPHVFAENDEDLYFIQGYLHAKFRLFQMDLSTKAAEGRASEIAGPKAIEFDREQRRLGMRFAAENSAKEVEKDPTSKLACDAYTRGVNAYISTLTESSMPLEYKLLDFKPEKWTNIRTALLLKMMAKMLSSGTENDLAYTNARTVFSADDLKMLYPEVNDSLEPIIPKGTVFDPPGIVPVIPAGADSSYINNKTPLTVKENSRPDPSNGSNNWVVSGGKTQSGSPILCNDPHLELSLPSIWYEMQLKGSHGNSYGVSLPGTPFIIIGFNDSIAWGVTNAQRDVKDYYEIKFKDDTKQEYWYNNRWVKTSLRVETIHVKGGADVLDTVAYTLFGPVTYDNRFSNSFSNNRALAVRWVAHDPSNESITFYKLNSARNYDDYENAIKSFACPGQNFVFASKNGDIAIWQQGKFPARWPGQGLAIMPGQDNSYQWQGFIPQAENPHSKNPTRGFLESANQRPVDSSYPYFIPGTYITPRGVTISNYLSAMQGITTTDMEHLQTNYYNTLGGDVREILTHFIRENELGSDEKKYLSVVKNWDLMASPESTGQTIYQCWWDSLQSAIYKDELTQVNPQAPWPAEQTTMELLRKDSAMKFIDDIRTPQKESLSDLVTVALKRATVFLKKKESDGDLQWAKFKKPGIYHLLDANKKSLLPFDRTQLNVGGSGNIINAVTQSHGPSWRMVVQLSTPTVAYGVYPGGESGNPGSKFYDNQVDQWADGKYYELWMMQEADRSDKKIKWTMKFSKG